MKELKYVNGNIMKSNATSEHDEYFTKPELSERLFDITKKIISQYDDLEKYTWLEPSVGKGCFFDQLPPNKRIGVDIKPVRPEVVCSDYLEFPLPNTPLIVIGNPPFGHRGVLALEFINHSSSADYVAFILPMFYQSLGKGSIRYRVKNFNLIYEEELPSDSFYLEDGTTKDVKCCFQIWSKNHTLGKTEYNWYSQRDKKFEPYKDIIEVVTVSLAKKRECGKKWIFDQIPNYYLSSSFYSNISVVHNFSEVKYKSGIALIYKTEDIGLKNKLDDIFTTANWYKYSSLATNGCRHIGKSHIYKLLKDNLIGE